MKSPNIQERFSLLSSAQIHRRDKGGNCQLLSRRYFLPISISLPQEIANLPVSSCIWIPGQSGTDRDTIETPMGKFIVLYGDPCMAFMRYVRDTFETA
ncbi:unnamed protein product, partial [Didymodactylos carnosus]